jgi:glycosyltransferase involved in cell wall biosynthesis
MSDAAIVRVAFVQASLPIGGAERLVQALAERMDRARIQPSLVNLYGPGAIGEQMQARGWSMTNHLAAWRFDPGVAGRLAHALSQVDVAYVFDGALALFWMGQVRRRQARPRLVVGFHSTGQLGDAIQHFFARGSAIPVADALVALTESHRRSLAAELRVPESRFQVLGSGVDLARFDPVLPRVAARRAAGLPETGLLVGIVAALRPEKHHALFVEAAARVSAAVPDARFVIAGDGPARDEVARLAIARSTSPCSRRGRSWRRCR